MLTMTLKEAAIPFADQFWEFSVLIRQEMGSDALAAEYQGLVGEVARRANRQQIGATQL